MIKFLVFFIFLLLSIILLNRIDKFIYFQKKTKNSIFYDKFMLHLEPKNYMVKKKYIFSYTWFYREKYKISLNKYIKLIY